MWRSFSPLFGLALASCITVGQDSSDGGEDAGASSTSTLADGGARGVNCGKDPTTGVTLCLAISTCELSVNQNELPGCGFRVNGSWVDLACSCSGYVCSMGGVTSCAQAQKLLSQSLGEVCNQVAEGRCTEGSPTTPADASSGSCDRACAATCVGDPLCTKMCGC